PFDEERVRALFEAFPRGASDALAEAWNETKRRTGSQRRTSTLVDRYQQIEGIVEQLGENATGLDRLKTGWASGKLERSRKTHLEEILSFLDEVVDPPGEVRALRDFCRGLPKVLPSLEALLAGRLLPHVEACVDRIERAEGLDRKSTRLNSSHVKSSYAVFCLTKKKNILIFLDMMLALSRH